MIEISRLSLINRGNVDNFYHKNGMCLKMLSGRSVKSRNFQKNIILIHGFFYNYYLFRHIGV